MEDDIFWVWLQIALGMGSLKADKVIGAQVSPEKLYGMSGEELAHTGFFAAGEVRALKTQTLDMPKTILRQAKELGCRVITPNHPDYPKNLTHIDRMPCVLYVLGDLSTLENELLLAMVGTRSSTEYGEYAAFRLSRDLAAAGCTVVSGLAVGIDCAAHEGALSLDGRTIGLLACGLDVNYPKPSEQLKKRILSRNGVLITEFPFGMAAMPHHFNIRNRLLAGISSGVVVVEAPLRSGALNSANHALEQNKDVFAVPGSIFAPQSAGCNRLIRDGARLVLNGYSILGEYMHRFPPSIEPGKVEGKIQKATKQLEREQRGREAREQQTQRPNQAQEDHLAARPPGEASSEKLTGEELDGLGISAHAKVIYEVLCFEPANCCDIAQRTGLRIMEIMSGLTELELSELADPGPGQRYMAKGKKL